MMTPKDIWNAAKAQLEIQFDRQSYDAWIRRAEFADYMPDDALMLVHVPNTMIRDMLQERLYRNIRKVVADIAGVPKLEIRFEYVKPEPINWGFDFDDDDAPLFKFKAQQEKKQQLTLPVALTEPPSPPNAKSIVEVMRTPDPMETVEGSALNDEYTFARFVVTSSNMLAHETAKAVAENPGTAYNPLVIHSNVGLGKTHLLQAIAHHAKACGYRALYAPAESFTNHLLEALRQRTTAMFKQTYRKLDLLLVDDIQFIGGKESTEEEFFHTFNALVQAKRQVVVSSDRPPQELMRLTERLRSRLQGGMVADIVAPDYEARFLVVQMWAEEAQLKLTNATIDMIVNSAPKNFRELRGAFCQIKAQINTYGTTLPIAKVEQTLERYASPRDRVTVAHIIEVVAQKHGLTSTDLIGKRRTESLNLARQIAMYLARELTESSLPMIGDHFGGRSHSTVLHAYNKLQKAIEEDPLLRARVEKLRRAVSTPH